MKKGIVAVAATMALLMCFSLNGFAAQTKEPPANLNGVVAYSFEGVTEVKFTNENNNDAPSTYFSGNSPDVESITNISLIDLDGS